MGLLAEIKAEFGANGLYELFGVAPKCTPAELKRAYLDAARKYHPDKAQGDLPAATRKFQILSRAHALLSEPEARKVRQRVGGECQDLGEVQRAKNSKAGRSLTCVACCGSGYSSVSSGCMSGTVRAGWRERLAEIQLAFLRNRCNGHFVTVISHSCFSRFTTRAATSTMNRQHITRLTNGTRQAASQSFFFLAQHPVLIRRTVYFRRLFPKVSSSMINSFVSKYQGSEEEKNDVKAAYLKHKGDMNALFDEVMASNPLEDEDRFRQMIGGWIADGSVPAFPAYVNEKPAALKKRMDKAKKEAAEAEEELHEHRAQEARSNTDSLQALILARQKERDSMWERFEAKHTNKAKKRAQRDNVPLETLEQPSEEDFLATQARLEARRKQATSKAKKEEEDDEEDENETAEAVSRPRKLSKKAGASTKKGAAAKPAKAANAAKQTAKSPARGR